jgi:hypothetical protein
VGYRWHFAEGQLVEFDTRGRATERTRAPRDEGIARLTFKRKVVMVNQYGQVAITAQRNHDA